MEPHPDVVVANAPFHLSVVFDPRKICRLALLQVDRTSVCGCQMDVTAVVQKKRRLGMQARPSTAVTFPPSTTDSAG